MGDAVSLTITGLDVEVSLVTVSGLNSDAAERGEVRGADDSIRFIFGKYHRWQKVA
jgi:hypothetical protein